MYLFWLLDDLPAAYFSKTATLVFIRMLVNWTWPLHCISWIYKVMKAVADRTATRGVKTQW